MAQKPDEGFGPGAYAFWASTARWSSPLFRWIWNVELSGEPPPPPYVMAGNHFSHVDVVLIGQSLGPIRYLAVDELYGQVAWFDRLITWLGAIPMSRVKVPLNALQTALDYLAAGGVVGVFPEGRRVWTWGEVTAPKKGAAWLAVRAGVPVVPVAIWGTQESFGRGATRIKRWPVSISVGPALHPSDYEDRADPVADITADWSRWVDGAVAQLKERSARRSG